MERDAFRGQRALLRFLQREGKISAADALRIEQVAQRDRITVPEALEREGILSEQELADLLASVLKLPRVRLASVALDPQVTRAVKEVTATKYQIVPLKLGDGTIQVATANPLDLDALRAVEFATGRRAQPAVATRVEIQDALAHAYRLEESLEAFLRNIPAAESLTVTEVRDEPDSAQELCRDAELPPVVKLADRIIVDGIRSRASDIHLEPSPVDVTVRCRIDGMLEETFRFPKWVQNPLVARFKVMAGLDITERRIPQDGRIRVRYGESQVDLRVSSLPTQHGEKIVLRVLDPSRAIHSLEALGFSPDALARVRRAARRPEGMILVTGPTGSGKTTTLYALLQDIRSPNVNIVTIENPIEYELPGITQVEVNEKQGLTFASVLRSTLRQDPDVILVGEIRDEETAQIAFQAAQTGHLVLSTLHTNDAVATVTRLLDLGVEPYVVASSVNLIVAQRLVRRVCPACSVPYTPPDESRRLLRLDDYRKEFRRGAGCAACRQTGYAGRIGVYEVLSFTPTIVQLIEAGAGESVIRQQARSEGFSGLLEDALEKLAAGLTTAEEVLRVIQVTDGAPRCPNCEAEVEDSFTACPHCGQALKSTCPACGKVLQWGWTSCPYCGDKGTAKARATEETMPRPAPARPAATRARSFKALVVDDDPDLRRIVRMTLERAGLGLTVLTAQDGEEALALAQVESPDVVILDLSMPGMDGFEVCRRLRADVKTAFLPVLMLTAREDSASLTEGFRVGADDYVVKPVRREELVARVRRMIERTYGLGSGEPPGQDGSGETVSSAARGS
ncbi:MAG: hypothetical protein KatS3mg076_1122 [Candidatus Binatia bacterium]|nr:MAG: hypothetical protein KatS3mg076_1122 [Candidatus Binatia bacterium]